MTNSHEAKASDAATMKANPLKLVFLSTAAALTLAACGGQEEPAIFVQMSEIADASFGTGGYLKPDLTPLLGPSDKVIRQ